MYWPPDTAQGRSGRLLVAGRVHRGPAGPVPSICVVLALRNLGRLRGWGAAGRAAVRLPVAASRDGRSRRRHGYAVGSPLGADWKCSPSLRYYVYLTVLVAACTGPMGPSKEMSGYFCDFAFFFSVTSGRLTVVFQSVVFKSATLTFSCIPPPRPPRPPPRHPTPPSHALPYLDTRSPLVTLLHP